MASQEHYFFLVTILRAKHGGILVIYSQGYHSPSLAGKSPHIFFTPSMLPPLNLVFPDQLSSPSLFPTFFLSKIAFFFTKIDLKHKTAWINWKINTAKEISILFPDCYCVFLFPARIFYQHFYSTFFEIRVSSPTFVYPPLPKVYHPQPSYSSNAWINQSKKSLNPIIVIFCIKSEAFRSYARCLFYLV